MGQCQCLSNHFFLLLSWEEIRYRQAQQQKKGSPPQIQLSICREQLKFDRIPLLRKRKNLASQWQLGVSKHQGSRHMQMFDSQISFRLKKKIYIHIYTWVCVCVSADSNQGLKRELEPLELE